MPFSTVDKIALVCTAAICTVFCIAASRLTMKNRSAEHMEMEKDFESTTEAYESQIVPVLQATTGSIKDYALRIATEGNLEELPAVDSSVKHKLSAYFTAPIPISALVSELPPQDDEPLRLLSVEVTLSFQRQRFSLRTDSSVPLWRYENVTASCTLEYAFPCGDSNLCCESDQMDQYCEATYGDTLASSQYYENWPGQPCTIGEECGVCQRAAFLQRVCYAVKWNGESGWSASEASESCEFRNLYAFRNTWHMPQDLSIDFEIRALSDPVVAWYLMTEQHQQECYRRTIAIVAVELAFVGLAVLAGFTLIHVACSIFRSLALKLFGNRVELKTQASIEDCEESPLICNPTLVNVDQV